jgi:hypothetical protein
MRWPIEWNRPLSKEEREIAKRLQCAPERTDFRVEAMVRSLEPRLPDECVTGDLSERRGANAGGGSKGTWVDGLNRVGEGRSEA